MNIKKHIPNSLTCANLLCGCIGVKFAFEGALIISAYLIALAAVFDFFDGFAARLLNAKSPIGKDLDSLADMVTFGLLPGVIFFKMMTVTIAIHGWQGPFDAAYIPYFAFVLTIFSALRLAKFNIDVRQSESFIGVPTPAITLLVASFPMIMNNPDIHNYGSLSNSISNLSMAITYTPNFADNLLLNIYVLLGLTVLFSYLLIAELPLFAMKFKNFGWPDNKIRYVFIISCLLLLIIFKFAAVPLIIILYVALSVVNNFTKAKTQP